MDSFDISPSGVPEDKIKDVQKYVENVRVFWDETGCSILLDGWTDAKGQSFTNVFVACSERTVYLMSHKITKCKECLSYESTKFHECLSYESTNLNECASTWLWFLDLILKFVGIEHVVQIITNSTSTFMKGIGEKVMQKYRTIFWTVSASCCIELMLEKIREMDKIEDTLDKVKCIAGLVHRSDGPLQDIKNSMTEIGSVTSRSTVPYLILDNIISRKQALKNFFRSSNSTILDIISTTEGKRVSRLVGNHSFWKDAEYVAYATIPLVRVMENMNENKFYMPHIYNAIEQAKLKIRQNLRESHKPFWDLIDGVWNEHLHSSIHCAGYFLNPYYFYSDDAYVDSEIMTGVFSAIFRTIDDLHVGDQIALQLEVYRKAKKEEDAEAKRADDLEAKEDFNEGCGEKKRLEYDERPEKWWIRYGKHCPELQRTAVRILSQTCDGASKFHIDKSLVQPFLEDDIVSSTIFLQYNRTLRDFHLGMATTGDKISLINEWIEGKTYDGGRP